jgi:hypothetical protein
MRKLVLLPFLLLAFACGDSAVVQPDDHLSVTASVMPGCQAIRFEVALVLAPGGPNVGTVTGDLVGTILTVFPQPGVWHGKAFLNDGTDFVSVTGGSVPELNGTTLELRHDNMAVGAPGLGALARINGHGTIVAPEEATGHLNFHGTLDTSGFPFTVTLTYQGSICVG